MKLRNRVVRVGWDREMVVMQTDAVTMQPKMAEGASLFRPTLAGGFTFPSRCVEIQNWI